MSWLWVLIAAWIGFILGYATCALLSLVADSPTWTGRDTDD